MVRVLIDGEQDRARNMAVDEALLKLCKEPVLRFYRWSEQAVSIGYFQSWEVVPKERPFVRRYTGGGLVDHEKDFTYSIIVPKSHAIHREGIHASYRRIHEQITKALNDAGIEAMLEQSDNKANEPACFKKAVRFDIVNKNKKLAGAAQRRTREGCLHQGSVVVENLDFESFIKSASPHLIKIMDQTSEQSSLTKEEENLAKKLKEEKYSTKEWNYFR